MLQVNRTLTYLDIRANFCHLHGALAIAACLKVQHAVIAASAACRCGQVNTALTTLLMSLNAIEDAGARVVAESLKVHTHALSHQPVLWMLKWCALCRRIAL